MSRQVALLRGINVGGKNKLPMKDLVALFESVGCTGVTTYIQSGNVIFDGRAGPDQLEAAIRKRHGLEVPVVVRTAAELAAVVRRPPFDDVETMHVMFLAGAPAAAKVAALDPARSPGDSFVVRGQEIYLSLPNGAGRSKLTNAYFDRALATISTARNWRTVLALVELARS